MSNQRGLAIEDLLRLRVVAEPCISPDESRIVFAIKTMDQASNHYFSHLWIVSLDKSSPRQLTCGKVDDSQPRWSPDGRSIAFVRTSDDGDSQIWVIEVSRTEDDAPAVVPWQLTHLCEGDTGTPLWSPDGKRLAFTFRPQHPNWTRAAQAKRQKCGRSDPPRIITPDNYQRAGAGYRYLWQHIWLCDVSTGAAHQLTVGDCDDHHPAWSSDGRWLAFWANRGENREQPYAVDLWLIDAVDGKLRKIPTPPGYKDGLAWSPDGSQIAYVGSNESRDDPWAPHFKRIWIASLGDDPAWCLTDGWDCTAENATISDIRELDPCGQGPAWSPDGKELFFLASDRGNCHLFSAPVSKRAHSEISPEPVLDDALDVSGFCASATGRELALTISRPMHPPELFAGRRGIDDTWTVQPKPVTRVNLPLLSEVRLSQPEQVWIRSFDGAAIHGWLLKPPDFDPGNRYPLLLYIHGGPDMQYGNAFFHELQAHAARGYVVCYVNPRGSMGYGEQFAKCIRGNWGGLDFGDLMAATDMAAALPYVDSARMGVAGGSYGGWMVAWIIGRTDRFRCAIAERGTYNRHSAFGTSDWPPLPDGYWPGNSWDRPQRLWEQSPLRYAANIRTPLLIIHGDGDLRCPVEQAEQLFTALRLLGREVRFLRYGREAGHDLSRNGPPDLRIDRLRRIADWLDKYLKPTSQHVRQGTETGEGNENDENAGA